MTIPARRRLAIGAVANILGDVSERGEPTDVTELLVVLDAALTALELVYDEVLCGSQVPVTQEAEPRPRHLRSIT